MYVFTLHLTPDTIRHHQTPSDTTSLTLHSAWVDIFLFDWLQVTEVVSFSSISTPTSTRTISPGRQRNCSASTASARDCSVRRCWDSPRAPCQTCWPGRSPGTCSLRRAGSRSSGWKSSWRTRRPCTDWWPVSTRSLLTNWWGREPSILWVSSDPALSAHLNLQQEYFISRDKNFIWECESVNLSLSVLFLILLFLYRSSRLKTYHSMTMLLIDCLLIIFLRLISNFIVWILNIPWILNCNTVHYYTSSIKQTFHRKYFW